MNFYFVWVLLHFVLSFWIRTPDPSARSCCFFNSRAFKQDAILLHVLFSKWFSPFLLCKQKQIRLQNNTERTSAFGDSSGSSRAELLFSPLWSHSGVCYSVPVVRRVLLHKLPRFPGPPQSVQQRQPLFLSNIKRFTAVFCQPSNSENVETMAPENEWWGIFWNFQLKWNRPLMSET